MKMKMPDDFWIEINENMFLNRTFKYVLYDEVTQKAKRYKPGKPVVTMQKAQIAKSVKEIKTKIELIDQAMTDNKEVYETKKVVNFLTKRVDKLKSTIDDMSEGYLETFEDIKKLKANYVTVINRLNALDKSLQTLHETYTRNHQDFVTQVKEVIEDLRRYENDFIALKKNVQENSEDIDSIEERVVILEGQANSVSYTLHRLNESIERGEEPDKDHQFSAGQLATATRRRLFVSEVSVSMTPIVKTDLAFLYSSVVENSLINNRESRLLCTFPATSKRGYTFFQFAQPIYRSITIRQFMDISFEILDNKEKSFDFNLYGDDHNKENREYPTILNLHIRRAIKGQEYRTL